MSDQQSLLPVKIEPILEMIQDKAPKMMKARDGAVSAMTSFNEKIKGAFAEYQKDPDGTRDTMTALIDEGNGLLVKVKKTFDGVQNWRKEMTGPLDQVKEFLMQYEKDLAYDGKSKNIYTDIRNSIQQFMQAELDARKAKEEELAKAKAKENYKVDLVSSIKKNLLNLHTEKIEKANSASRDYFNAATLENFDEKAKVFMGFKGKLKIEDYDKCFTIFFDKNIITQEEFSALVIKAKGEETWDKWNEKLMIEVNPVLNEWRAKIPDIKKQKIELAQANEEEKEKIKKAQEDQAKAEDERVRMAAVAQKKESEAQLEQEAEVNKMSNEFAEQANVQTMEDTGPSKKVLKFDSARELQGKAFLSIAYHVMMSPKFPGIHKVDKASGELVLDAKGAPQYIDSVGWWVRFFETHCKSKTVEGAEWVDQAKVIVRK